MAIDYVFVGICLTFSLGTVFMLLGFFQEGAFKALFHFFSFLAYLLQTQLFLSVGSTTTLPLYLLSWMLTLANFALFLAWGIYSVRLVLKRRKYGEEFE